MHSALEDPRARDGGEDAPLLRAAVVQDQHERLARKRNGVDELLLEQVVSSRNRRNPRGVKRKMSNFPLRRKGHKPLPTFDPANATRILK